MSRSRGKAPSQRQLRVGEELRHVLVEILAHADFDDPELAEANVTVTQVEVSPDLQSAVAFIVPLGGERMEQTVRALNRAAGYLRGQLGREITLRYTPRLSFAADRSFDAAAEIERLLHSPRVRRDLEDEAGSRRPGDEETDDGASA